MASKMKDASSNLFTLNESVPFPSMQLKFG